MCICYMQQHKSHMIYFQMRIPNTYNICREKHNQMQSLNLMKLFWNMVRNELVFSLLKAQPFTTDTNYARKIKTNNAR